MISIELSNVSFESNDIITVELNKVSSVVLNSISEDVVNTTEPITECILNQLNIEYHTDVDIHSISNIIGIKTFNVSVVSDYAELQGKVLTLENKDKCRIEIDDDTN